MEVIRDSGSWRHTEVDDATQVGAARRQVALVCEEAGIAEDLAAKASLAAVELATNLHKHARRGRLFVRATPAQGKGDRAIDVVSVDHGPGMDLQRCFADGFSTSQTSGSGLGALRRLASLFDAYSDAAGSVIFARVGKAATPVEYGSLAIPLRGELLSGDQWTLVADVAGWSLVMADGLGHGPLAHAASAATVGLRELRGSPAQLLARAHEASRSTRGSAAAVLRRNDTDASFDFASVGNLQCVIDRRDDVQTLVSQNGTVGGAFPSVRETRVPGGERSLSILHTDGLSTRWSLERYPGLRTRHPQVVCGVLFRDCYRGRDDATIVAIRS
ncbi:ATP-binding protein [Lysobacter auxotrophicus]|uniref:SpoIIE family protein phosphatase n=1 Tax=Lysobacter auxotrophicus TaxID=2992573 RepID=A0ABM8DD99_9GAMM|nr:ATP-binding protein [Lysobacter auxotrophicus]BDU16573.1 SpoIIE family protein phosphatase [Lysobacter auxotrophicus]